MAQDSYIHYVSARAKIADNVGSQAQLYLVPNTDGDITMEARIAGTSYVATAGDTAITFEEA